MFRCTAFSMTKQRLCCQAMGILMWLTYTGESISAESRQTGAGEACYGVGAGGSSTTASVVCCALVNIYMYASQGKVEWNSWIEIRQVQHALREKYSRLYYKFKCSEVVLSMYSKMCLIQNCVHDTQTNRVSLSSQMTHLPCILHPWTVNPKFRHQLFTPV